MKGNCILVTFLLVTKLAIAQQTLPNLVHYFENLGLYNPAAIAWKSDFLATLNYRGVINKPVDVPMNDALALFEKDLGFINSGIGVNYALEEFVFHRIHRIGLNYRYTQQFGEHTNLSIGVTANYISKMLDASQFNIVDPQFEPIKYRGNSALFNAGLFFNHKGLSLGFSAVNLNKPTLILQPSSVFPFNFERFYHAHGAFEFLLIEDFKLTPRAHFTFYRNGYQTLFSAELNWKNKVYVAPGYRYKSNALSMSIKAEVVPNFILGVAYEYIGGYFKRHDFEVMLGYRLKKKS